MEYEISREFIGGRDACKFDRFHAFETRGVT
jgi:hypothetical protein